MLIFMASKSHFKGSYGKQNLTLMVISYEIYETSLHTFHIDWPKVFHNQKPCFGSYKFINNSLQQNYYDACTHMYVNNKFGSGQC